MELKIILILTSLYVLLKTISCIQRDLYFDNLARQKGQRLDWITKHSN